MNDQELHIAIRHGVVSNDWSLVDDWFLDIPEGVFHESVIDTIISALRNPGYLKADGNYELLHHLELEWDRITTHQANRLFAPLTSAFMKSDQWMMWFIITEILGRFYANEAALAALQGFAEVAVGVRRELIPQGFDNLARNAVDANVSREAVKELRLLAKDNSDAVRREVDLSFGRLSGSPRHVDDDGDGA